MRPRLAAIACCLALVGVACTAATTPTTIRVGAVYPLSGSQGPGGIDEHRGVLLAADLANEDGGVDGRSIDDRVGRHARLRRRGGRGRSSCDDAGIDLVLGSYGSTISAPASAEAAATRHAVLGDRRGRACCRPAPTAAA